MWMRRAGVTQMSNDAISDPVTIVSPAAAAAMPQPPDNLATPILSRHGVETEYYAPRGVDTQTPHDRDELYIVSQGSGWFVAGDQRRRFAAGDLIFVPAGVDHRFEDFSVDFSTWVVFFGPQREELSKP
jgi:mannose-6-phosphate isomerase-like protein (cupin superfamily)